MIFFFLLFLFQIAEMKNCCPAGQHSSSSLQLLAKQSIRQNTTDSSTKTQTLQKKRCSLCLFFQNSLENGGVRQSGRGFRTFFNAYIQKGDISKHVNVYKMIRNVFFPIMFELSITICTEKKLCPSFIKTCFLSNFDSFLYI